MKLRLPIFGLLLFASAFGAKAASPATAPSESLERQVRVLQEQVSELRIEVAQLKAISGQVSPKAAENGFDKFIAECKSVNLQFSDGLTFSEFREKVGGVSDKLAAISTASASKESSEALELCKKILSGYVFIRDGWQADMEGALPRGSGLSPDMDAVVNHATLGTVFQQRDRIIQNATLAVGDLEKWQSGGVPIVAKNYELPLPADLAAAIRKMKGK